MALYLYEFLYRGRPADHPEPPAYHVILADATTDAFNQPHVNVGPAMTPEQASAMGFDLPAIIKAINAGVMAENTALKAAQDELQQRHDQLAGENVALKQTLAAKDSPPVAPSAA
jgi:hypothetical protein